VRAPPEEKAREKRKRKGGERECTAEGPRHAACTRTLSTSIPPPCRRVPERKKREEGKRKAWGGKRGERGEDVLSNPLGDVASLSRICELQDSAQPMDGREGREGRKKNFERKRKRKGEEKGDTWDPQRADVGRRCSSQGLIAVKQSLQKKKKKGGGGRGKRSSRDEPLVEHLRHSPVFVPTFPMTR